jgi:hypothetical protein
MLIYGSPVFEAGVHALEWLGYQEPGQAQSKNNRGRADGFRLAHPTAIMC